jgi:tight adherence protein C
VFDTSVLMPLVTFGLIMAGTWFVLSLISNRNSAAEDRLERIGRPKSLADIDIGGGGGVGGGTDRRDGMAGFKNALANWGGGMAEGASEIEKNTLKVKLANAGFRSESAPAIFQGLRLVSMLVLLGPTLITCLLSTGFTLKSLQWIVLFGGLGFYLPGMGLWYLRRKRQQEIFLTLPDALDLLVVCVESGLGLDAAMRKVTDEMKGHAKIICEEFALANLQMQMGRPRREVLHDLGVRTGVDDVRSLAAILIQADRFGSSIAQALRVQSDSMRTRRRQLAEEKAAKTAVQLIFPLVLFIFPGIFVVLVGPAAINIQRALLNK